MDRSTDLWTFGRGDNFRLQEYLGAHKETRGEQEGFTFRVWAPNAQAVDLIGKTVKFQWFVMKEASGKSSVRMQKREISTNIW